MNHPPEQYTPDPDTSIQLTDTDAAIARLSAVRKGYCDDPYIKHLVPRSHLQPSRPPLINIGTFTRGAAIDELTNQWLEKSAQAGTQCQIVSLGAGSDTRFWRLATGKHSDALAAYIEIDFPEVTSKKNMAIRKSKELSAVLGTSPSDIVIVNGGTTLHTPRYHLLAADLRRPPSETIANLTAPPPSSDVGVGPILSTSLPTLLLFECVLVYMEPSDSDAILQWFVEQYSVDKTPLGAIVYEMFGLEDAFGKVMVNNLKSRNVLLPGAKPYTTADALPRRFLNAGFTAARALTLREIRKAYIPFKELKRLSTLEMLDEVEELDLVLDHYAVTWGLLLPEMQGLWKDWGLRHQQWMLSR